MSTSSVSDIPHEVDLLVVGSGAGGLTAALTGSLSGLSVLVVEHLAEIGGTSARSSGTVWVPDNHFMQDGAFAGDRQRAETYLEALVGDRGSREMWQRFLDAAPEMIKALAPAGVAFAPGLTAVDYRQDLPGAGMGGRPLYPQEFDGRRLGSDFERLAAPLRELMLFGGLMVTRPEAEKLLKADQSLSAFWLGARLIVRFLVDRFHHSRGTRLVLGNALVARLLFALQTRQVPVLTRVQVDRLTSEGERLTSAEVQIEGRSHAISARKGVILAGGGFPASPELREVHLPKPVAAHTPASEGCDGSTIKLAQAAGAMLGPDTLDNGQWFPSSLLMRDDCSIAVFPHIVLDRAKPGCIAVDQTGNRFVNEAVSYHEFVRGMYRAHAKAPAIPAWLIATRGFVARYGLGVIRPRTPLLGKYIRSGYLKTGKSVAALAAEIKVPEEALEATIARFNRFAATGKDTDFRRGENAYERGNGDPQHGPNPSLGPLDKGPWCAVALHPTPLGTSRGIAIDPDARALGADGQPIPGLYVVGNDAQSVFGGEYPGAGGQLGQAMTFGWLAARHAAGHAFKRQEG